MIKLVKLVFLILCLIYNPAFAGRKEAGESLLNRLETGLIVGAIAFVVIFVYQSLKKK